MSGSSWMASQQGLFCMEIVMLTGGAAVRGKQVRCCIDVATRAWPQTRGGGGGAITKVRLAWSAIAEWRQWMRWFLLSPGTLRRMFYGTDTRGFFSVTHTVHVLALNISTNTYTEWNTVRDKCQKHTCFLRGPEDGTTVHFFFGGGGSYVEGTTLFWET